MNKQEFLKKLRRGLSGLPEEEREERLNFYSEVIDDRMEEGMTEEEAVAGVGTVEEIVSQITAEIPLSRLVRKRMKPKRTLKAWEILLLILGSPLWIALLVAAAAIVFSVYAVIWSVGFVTAWAVEISLIAGTVAGIAGAFGAVIHGNIGAGIAALGAGLVLAGLSILFFYVCLKTGRAILFLSKKILLCIKSIFIQKENEQ